MLMLMLMNCVYSISYVIYTISIVSFLVLNHIFAEVMTKDAHLQDVEDAYLQDLEERHA